MSDSTATPLNEQVHAIRDALWHRTKHGSARVIVGAGFSLNAEPKTPGARPFPLWRELAATMSAKLPDGGDVNSPLHLAQAYNAKFGTDGLRKLIESEVPDIEHIPGELHRHLVRLPWVDIFTTNYDTLLERAAVEIRDAPYHPILSTTESAGKHTRRLVKLHGTVGAPSPLVATLNDYLNYEITHEPFVTLMRQALAESIFVLVGFNGDDPNFEQFLNRVHRCFGSVKPQVYWCGLDLNDRKRLVLESQGITPLDLSAVVTAVDPELRHAMAYKWLFDKLDARPAVELNWAPRESNSLNHGFTPFSEFPPPDGKASPERLREIAGIWYKQRQEYPGWHLLPDEVRERVWGIFQHWRRTVFYSAGEIDPVNRLLVIYEFYWRMELTLGPIFTTEADVFVKWLEEVNPFGQSLSLQSAIAPAETEQAAVSEAWLFLAFCVLRTARDDLDATRFNTWHDLLNRVAGDRPAVRGELNHESLLYALNDLNLSAFRIQLIRWRMNAVLPIEFAQLAAYYAEADDRPAAIETVNRAIALLGSPTPATLWLESWCHILLHALHWNVDTKAQQRSDEAIARAKRQGYDAWGTLENFRGTLKNETAPYRPSISYKARFDDGDVRRNIHFGGSNDDIPAFQLLRFLERAPAGVYAGRFSNCAEAAAHAAVWLGTAAPSWTLATLLRAKAKPEVVDELYDRLTIASCDQAAAEAICDRLLNLSQTEIARLPDKSDALGVRMVITGLDVLSRFALRLRSSGMHKLLECYRAWYVNPAVVERSEIVSALEPLFSRVAGSLPDEDIASVIVSFLELPVYGESGFRPNAHEELWSEPFEKLLNRRSKPPQGWELSLNIWGRLMGIVRSRGAIGRRFAFSRLYYLHLNHWLTPDQDDAFEEALWGYTDDASKLPVIPGYRSRLVLQMRGAEARNATTLLKEFLLSRWPKPWANPDDKSVSMDLLHQTELWIQGLAQAFRHEAFSVPDEITLSLDGSEAVRLAENVLQWVSTVRQSIPDRKAADHGMDSSLIEQIVDGFASLFGESLLFRIEPGHPLINRAVGEFVHLHQLGYPMYRLFPGQLFLRPELAGSHAAQLVRAVLSEDRVTVRAGIDTIHRWYQGAKKNLLPAMPVILLDTAAVRIGLRHEPGVTRLIRCITLIVEDMGKECPMQLLERLILASAEIADASEPSTLKRRLSAGEVDRKYVVEHLHLRSWAAFMARKLETIVAAKGMEPVKILRRWQEIREQAVLPEIRQA